MQQRSPISIYPPNADSWAHSGWDEDYPQLDQETPPPPTTANTGAALVATSSAVPTIQVVGSATASADTYGAFAIAFETQEQFEA